MSAEDGQERWVCVTSIYSKRFVMHYYVTVRRFLPPMAVRRCESEVVFLFEHLVHEGYFITELMVQHKSIASLIICSLGLLIHALLPSILTRPILIKMIPVDHFMAIKVK